MVTSINSHLILSNLFDAWHFPCQWASAKHICCFLMVTVCDLVGSARRETVLVRWGHQKSGRDLLSPWHPASLKRKVSRTVTSCYTVHFHPSLDCPIMLHRSLPSFTRLSHHVTPFTSILHSTVPSCYTGRFHTSLDCPIMLHQSLPSFTRLSHHVTPVTSILHSAVPSCYTGHFHPSLDCPIMLHQSLPSFTRLSHHVTPITSILHPVVIEW